MRLSVSALFAFILGSTLVGCAENEPPKVPTALEIAARHVRIGVERPAGCAEIGDVTGHYAADEQAAALYGAKWDLRKHAAGRGGDYVQIIMSNAARDHDYSPFVNGGVDGDFQILLSGIAFRCAKPAPEPARGDAEHL
jgi:hypothetical protein